MRFRSTRSAWCVLPWAAIVLLVSQGCGSGPQEDVAVLAGRVAIDGEPVQKGGIQFMPLDQGRPAFSPVSEGAYSARVPKGRVRVILSAVKETGRQVQVYSTTVPEVVDALPPALRDGFEITVEGDDAARDFKLSSNGKAAR